MQYFRRDNRIYISNASLQDISNLERIAPLGQACIASPRQVDVYYTLPDLAHVRSALTNVSKAA
jgi:hypothetical protein